MHQPCSFTFSISVPWESGRFARKLVRPEPFRPDRKSLRPKQKFFKRTKYINLSRLYVQKMYFSFFTSTPKRKLSDKQTCISRSFHPCTGRIDFQFGRNGSGRTCKVHVTNFFVNVSVVVINAHKDHSFPSIRWRLSIIYTLISRLKLAKFQEEAGIEISLRYTIPEHDTRM